MYKDRKILALIPARGGSKKLPNKNILKLSKKPLIAYTIEASLASQYIDTTVVSTDYENIRKIAINYGAQATFLRPARLATDTATSFEVLKHVIGYYKKKYKKNYDISVMLLPTSPLRLSVDIDNAIELLFSKNAQAIVSVCRSERHPYWANTLPKDLSMKNFLDPKHDKCRQDLPECYRLNGSIYLAYVDYLTKQNSFYGKKTFAYIMPNERSIDIDSELDFKIAEFMLNSGLVR